jgi:hypothetical protein
MCHHSCGAESFVVAGYRIAASNGAALTWHGFQYTPVLSIATCRQPLWPNLSTSCKRPVVVAVKVRVAAAAEAPSDAGSDVSLVDELARPSNSSRVP